MSLWNSTDFNYEKTPLWFSGDYGYDLGEFGEWAKHSSLYKIGTHVPLIVVAPGIEGDATVAIAPV